MFNFTLDVDTSRDVMLVGWNNKSPATERVMHDLGGQWEDFNVYRLPLELSIIKKVYKHTKRVGDETKATKEFKAAVKDLKKRMDAAKSLTRADSDAEISELLKEEAPETAKAMRSYQRAGVKFMTINQATLLADSPGSGKAQPLSSRIATPEGWTTMGEISVGDEVIGDDGLPAVVSGVFPQGERKVAKITFSDGSVVRCDYEHLWAVKDHWRRTKKREAKVITVNDMLKRGLKESDGRKRFSVDFCQPVEREEKPFFLDAYTAGVLVGDGSISVTSRASIATDHEIISKMKLPEGAEAKLVEDMGVYGEYRLNGLSRHLRAHDFNGKRAEEKSIPQEILYGSIKQRVDFLHGLLDTDGGTPKGYGENRRAIRSAIEYGTVSKQLADDVEELVRSLGGGTFRTTKKPKFTYKGEKREGQLFYKVAIQLPDCFEPFTLNRKRNRWAPRNKYKGVRYIESIEEDGVEECQCIMVENKSHLYLTDGYVPTHNTLQTIATMVSAGVSGDILVLAPSAAIQVTWPAEISRWSPNDEIICATGTRKQREAELSKLKKKSRAKRRWVLCNIEMAKVKYHKPTANMKKGWYEYIYPELFFVNPNKESKSQKGKKKEWSAIAVDESHRALITNKTQAYKQTQTRAGLGKLKTVEGGKRIAISGTPFRGKPENLWGTLNWLMPDKYKSYWPWVDRWFNTSSGYFGGTEIHDMDKTTSKRFHESFSHFTLRRTKSEIAPDLPPKVYAGSIPPGVKAEPGQDKALIGHWLEMEPKQKRAYNQMVDEAIANLDNGTLVANGVLAEMTRLKQFASCYGTLETQLDSDGYEIPVFKPGFPSNKFNWLLEFLEELGIDKEKYTPGPETNKVVIASQFTSVIDLFDEALKKKGIDTAKITGKVSAKKREEAVRSFQQDSGPRVFLLNTIAGGVSLTLDRADDIVILDETFIPDDQEQVEDRVHRVSRDHNVTVHYVRSLGTIEERIAKLTFSRDSLQKQLLDGERGVEFARKIIG